MRQRISVRVRIIHDDRTLLVRRAEGRKPLVGMYELPGRRVSEYEQPEDAARRCLEKDLGITEAQSFALEDVMTYVDASDTTVQYAIIVYQAVLTNVKRAVSLNGRYDKYVWYTAGKVDLSTVTEVSRVLLGNTDVIIPVPKREIPLDEPMHAAPVDGIVLYTDGGSRGNPGPSAAGYVIIHKGEVVDQGGEYLGITTNNQAEYHGVRLGLEAALRQGIETLEVRVDSMLVANQLNGIYKIKNRDLWPINDRVRDLVGQFKRVTFSHVPREFNQLADGMVNRTLDHQKQLDMLQ